MRNRVKRGSSQADSATPEHEGVIEHRERSELQRVFSPGAAIVFPIEHWQVEMEVGCEETICFPRDRSIIM
jgi:hypothetical protein